MAMGAACRNGHVIAGGARFCPYCGASTGPVSPPRWKKWLAGAGTFAAIAVGAGVVSAVRTGANQSSATAPEGVQWNIAEQNFKSGCQETGTVAACSCTWNKIRSRYTLDDIRRLDKQYGQGHADPELTALFRSCF